MGSPLEISLLFLCSIGIVKNAVSLGGLPLDFMRYGVSWEVHLSLLFDWFEFQLSIIRLYLHVSSSYHTVRDGW